MRLLSSLLFLSFIFFSQAKSQTLQRQSISSAGSTMSANGNLVRQTIGQSYGTTSYYSNEMRYNPGFQQPVFRVETISSTISASVFPNPTSKQVTIETSIVIENAIVHITDMNGKLLLHETIATLKTYSLNCSDWADGVYFITLSDSRHNLYASKLIIAK